ncbi:MAG: hypothetical protein K8T20_01145 [Planctomycetes bacterium]|nr:hypothetical protein [Planctomycetota bacterium]
MHEMMSSPNMLHFTSIAAFTPREIMSHGLRRNRPFLPIDELVGDIVSAHEAEHLISIQDHASRVDLVLN